MAALPRFAVLFKTHFWDDFVERQFRRLCDRAGSGRVFVVVDETKAPVADIRHKDVVRMTEQMSETEGYLRYPAENVFWYNTDYQLYHFVDRHPEYEYIFICEYDCTVNIDISTIVEAMAEKGLSFVGERIRTPPSDWYWAALVRPYYSGDVEIAGRLVCCAAFSRGFARQLQAARRDHTRRALAQEIPTMEPNAIVWPNNEAFVGAEIARTSAAELPLSAFGDTSHYDWAPPHLEIELPNLSDCAVVHPVLDGPRYMRSLVNLKGDLEDLFRKGSHLRHRMDQCDPAYVVPMFLQHFADAKNWAAVEQLRTYASERIGELARVLFNVARGKPATQSSTSRWSRSPYLAEDAVAVNGQVTGQFGFHTDLEADPWWCVDLEGIYLIREICIYNRTDPPCRSRSLAMSYSTDLMHWTTLYCHESDSDFSGADGLPLAIRPSNPVELRFLRVHLPQKEFFHLDEVEIYV